MRKNNSNYRQALLINMRKDGSDLNRFNSHGLTQMILKKFKKTNKDNDLSKQRLCVRHDYFVAISQAPNA
jgi:hypothetical protein